LTHLPGDGRDRTGGYAAEFWPHLEVFVVGGSDRSRSIEEIEGDYWGMPPAPGTRLIDEVHRLRRVPVGELTVEDLRLLVGQGVALTVVMPLAVQRLEEDPLAEGDLFEGDLLTAVLRVPVGFWSDHPDLAERLRARLKRDRDRVAVHVPQVQSFLEQQ
jgi:hypothetical protein